MFNMPCCGNWLFILLKNRLNWIVPHTTNQDNYQWIRHLNVKIESIQILGKKHWQIIYSLEEDKFK